MAKRLFSKPVRSGIVTILVLIVGFSTTWVMLTNRIQEPREHVPGGDPALGRSATAQYACVACHSIPGVPGAEGYIGPPLDNWAQRHFVAGTYPNKPEHLVAFMLDPQAVRPGSAMPNVGLTEEDAAHIAAYLYTIYDDWPFLGGAGAWPLWGIP
ncbi:c-type cytochrome [soil metagenome]